MTETRFTRGDAPHSNPSAAGSFARPRMTVPPGPALPLTRPITRPITRTAADFHARAQRPAAAAEIEPEAPWGDEPETRLPARTAGAGSPLGLYRPPAQTSFALPVLSEDDDAGGPLWLMQGEDGNIVCRRLNESYEPGALQFVVVGATMAWKRWEDSRPIEIRRYREGEHFPKRAELEPPPPADPRVKDTWSRSVYLHLEDPDSGGEPERFDFITSGRWAWGAVIGLLHKVRRRQELTPGACPVVRLDSVHHPAARGFRAFWSPAFPIVRWVHPDGSAEEEVEA